MTEDTHERILEDFIFYLARTSYELGSLRHFTERIEALKRPHDCCGPSPKHNFLSGPFAKLDNTNQ